MLSEVDGDVDQREAPMRHDPEIPVEDAVHIPILFQDLSVRFIEQIVCMYEPCCLTWFVTDGNKVEKL
jgi:hypothetical protein